MSSKNKIGLLTIFNYIVEVDLTPNQYYLLYCLHNSISPPIINLHQEIRHLVVNAWVKDETNATGNHYSLEPKALTLISKIDSYFGVQVKKAFNSTMGNDFEINANKYNEIFPRIKLGSNKAARAPLKEVIIAFKWFFDNYEYSWEVIHAAADLYIEGERKKKFAYTRTSKYFIRKQDTDKSWSSDLAGYCELVLNGEDFEKPKFSEKVY